MRWNVLRRHEEQWILVLETGEEFVGGRAHEQREAVIQCSVCYLSNAFDVAVGWYRLAVNVIINKLAKKRIVVLHASCISNTSIRFVF